MNKIAIIGLGNWGKRLFETFNEIADIATCCTTGKKENLDWLNKHFSSIKHTKNFDEIIANKAIEAVIIATPINTHYELTKKALLSKKHVFVEKPLSTNENQAKELQKIALENKLIIFTGNVFLYNEIFAILEKMNKISPFKYIQCDWNKFGTFTEDIFWNLAWHDILMTVKLMGKTTNIQLISYYGFFSQNDIVKIILSFPQEKKCIISINRLAKNTVKNAIFISKEKLLTWNNNSLYSLNQNNKDFENIFQSTQTPLSIECKEFISLLNKNSSKSTNSEAILETIRIIENLVNQLHEN